MEMGRWENLRRALLQVVVIGDSDITAGDGGFVLKLHYFLGREACLVPP